MEKTPVTDNRKLAWLALVLAVLLGVFGIGAVKLNGANRAAEQYYEKNLAADMTLRVNAARSIVQMGESVLSGSDVALEAAQSALAAMESAKTPAQQLAANANLTSSVGMLYEAVRAAAGEEKGGLLQGQWSEFTSRQNIMNNAMDGYEQAAQKVRSAARGIPGAWIAKMLSLSV